MSIIRAYRLWRRFGFRRCDALILAMKHHDLVRELHLSIKHYKTVKESI